MKGQGLRRRFALYIAIFFCLLLVIWLAYQIAVISYMGRTTREALALTERNLLSALDGEFSRMKLAAALIAGDDSVQDFLIEENVTLYYEKAESVSEIIHKAAYPHLGEDHILTVSADGTFYQFLGSVSRDATDKIDREVIKSGVTVYTVLELDGSSYFCLANPVYLRGSGDRPPIGYVVALSNLTKTRRLLTQLDTMTGIDTAVMMDGRILFSSNPALDGLSVLELERLYGSVTVEPITGSNLSAATVVSKEILNYSQRLWISISVAALLALALIIGVLYRWLSARMVVPMLQNAESMQMGLLKLQISAHFVLNTILCIKTLAEKGENTKAAAAAGNLAGMLQNLHSSNEESNIFRQLENLERYIEIMNIRYADKYETDIDADDRLCQYAMLGQVLQPLAENALVHGLGNKTEDCRMTVAGKLEADAVVFEVSDNGVGMESAKIKALQEMLDSAGDWDYDEYRLKGVALLNIQKRIRMRYGRDFGLTVKGAPGKGFTVTVRLPCIRDGA